jgi:integrase
VASHRPNGHAAPYRGADGWWHCHVSVGLKPDGKPDRRHVRRRTQKACSDAVDDLRQSIRAGDRAVTKSPTVEEWLDHWLETVVKPNRAYRTHTAYASLIRVHLVPQIGRYRIGGSRNVLQPEHLDACYAAMRDAGLASSYVLKAHRVLSRALKVAHRRGRAARNVCELVDPPSLRKSKPIALPMESVKKILAAVAEDRLAARWLVALLLGLRQGEVLGLRWGDLHLDTDHPMLVTQQQAQRRTWRHGCTEPARCASAHCRTEPCGPSWAHGCPTPGACKGNPRFCPQRQPYRCRRHPGVRGCPAPCPPGCTGHARSCPKRVGGGLVMVGLKSEGSERRLPLDPTLVQALKEHLRQQKAERLACGAGRPDGHDLVFASEIGTPIDPRRDHAAWEDVLARAGIPDAKLHAARHTAATLLVATGADISVVQEVLGHSDVRTARGYVDVAAELKREAVERMASVLFGEAFSPLVQHPGATGRAR